MSTVNILIIDDDQASQAALRQVLDNEGWRVHVVPIASAALREMAAGDWTLVIVNVAMTGLTGPVYTTLRELALAPAMESGKKRVRVLFLVPETVAQAAQPVLESERLPYALKPFNLHDFLDKISDLLLEAEAIPEPIRQVRREGITAARRRSNLGGRQAGTGVASARNTGMFASRDDYSMTEEEIAEYEHEEQEETARKKKKKLTGGA